MHFLKVLLNFSHLTFIITINIPQKQTQIFSKVHSSDIKFWGKSRPVFNVSNREREYVCGSRAKGM